jgi:hypothetical protein
MAIRYFKCHTLPFPSYDLVATPGTTDRLILTWRNGPNGQAEPTSTEVNITFDFDTASTSTVTTGGTATTYNATLGSSSGLAVRVRLRRVNTAGAGEWTPWVPGVVG